MHRMAVRIVAFGVAALAFGAASPTRGGQILVLQSDWTGSRSTPSGNGLVGLSKWADDPSGGLKVSWNISLSGGIYTYAYTFLDRDGTAIDPNVSHFLLEVSPTFTLANLLSKNFTAVAPQTYTKDPLSPGNTSPGGNGANPNLPADIFALKLDTGSDSVGGTYTFTTDRAPVWGDFYVKDGSGGKGKPANSAWNVGIGTDPVLNGTYANTSFLNWIPTPDTVSSLTAVPEPSSLVSCAIGGLVGLGLAWRRRRAVKAG